jgi:predicted O-methyltransferase YrrM
MYPQMMTNELQGHLLSMISVLKTPNLILEIGTFTGYATICLAKGLDANGKIITIEKNKELENRINKNLSDARILNKTELFIGDAQEIIERHFSKMIESFDIIYIDADKENYQRYLELTYPLLNRKGIILADNIFWGGKVFEENTKLTKEINGIKNFLEAANKLKWQNKTIIPIGDGLFFGLK